jgi:hypothetical protein
VLINSKQGAFLCATLEDLGHPHPPYTIGNRQHHCHMIHQWKNRTKTHKNNGYSFLLHKRQSQTGSVQCVLGPRLLKFSRLFHKTPFDGTSQKNTRNSEKPMNRKGIRDSALRGCDNTSGKAGAHIIIIPLGDDSSSSGDSAVSL